MRIRLWQPGDQDALAPLLLAYMHETPEYDYVENHANVAQMFSLGLHSHLSMLAEDDTVVGFTNWITSPFQYRTRVCFGFGTYVTPDFRGQGIAKDLHDAAARRAAEVGFQVCERISHGGMGQPMLERDGWQLQENVRTYRRVL